MTSVLLRLLDIVAAWGVSTQAIALVFLGTLAMLFVTGGFIQTLRYFVILFRGWPPAGADDPILTLSLEASKQPGEAPR